MSASPNEEARKMIEGEASMPVLPPEEKVITLEHAIEANTLAVAYIIKLDDRVGSIEQGKLADLMAWERNLFDVPPQEIHQTKVLLTLMNGRVTHREDSL
jgi:predicted amidohydrolase YtcJ